MSRIFPIRVEMDAAAAAALLMAVDALSEDVADEYHRAAQRGGRAIQAALKAAKRAEDDERSQAEAFAAAEAARLAAIAGDQPFANPKIVQPNATAARPSKLSCEIRVFAAHDFGGGHQCNNAATFLRPDYDEWGDVALCPLHHSATSPGGRSLLFGYARPVLDDKPVTVPSSIRRTKREWLALRDARKVAAKT